MVFRRLRKRGRDRARVQNGGGYIFTCNILNTSQTHAIYVIYIHIYNEYLYIQVYTGVYEFTFSIDLLTFISNNQDFRSDSILLKFGPIAFSSSAFWRRLEIESCRLVFCSFKCS